MRLRSLLFVPGDRPERFAKAAQSGADAIILDLEDSVAPGEKARARAAVGDYLAGPRETFTLVRINPLDGPECAADLALLAKARPDGLMLPKAEGLASLTRLDQLLDGARLPVLPIATETPAAMFELGSYAQWDGPLLGLTWGAEDLPAAIGAETARIDGRYTPPIELARSLALFGAHKAGVAAIETVYPDIRDLDGLAAYAARGRRDGFTGMMALHPAQVGPINAAFTPGAEAIARAQAIVAAFAAAPGAGVLMIDGKMVDQPHLKQARAVLARAGG
ncbi:MAG: CoA ester lyase [Proteobacteria bacterium]|nr:CoA ester lyase [Pseudomonadota bacterium]